MKEQVETGESAACTSVLFASHFAPSIPVIPCFVIMCFSLANCHQRCWCRIAPFSDTPRICKSRVVSYISRHRHVQGLRRCRRPPIIRQDAISMENVMAWCRSQISITYFSFRFDNYFVCFRQWIYFFHFVGLCKDYTCKGFTHSKENSRSDFQSLKVIWLTKWSYQAEQIFLRNSKAVGKMCIVKSMPKKVGKRQFSSQTTSASGARKDIGP